MNQPEYANHKWSGVSEAGYRYCTRCQVKRDMATEHSDCPAYLTIPKPSGVRDWIEDYADEDNGCYQHTCDTCKQIFYGHKRRGLECKKCWVKFAGDFVVAHRQDAAQFRTALRAANKGAETNAKVNQLMATDLLKARTALETIRNMEVYLVDADINPDPVFMRDFFRMQFEKAVKYATAALSKAKEIGKEEVKS